MNFFEQVLNFLSAQMPRPGNYGWFHLMWVGIIIVAAILICTFFKDVSKKKYQKILWIMWAIIFLFEIYKQLQFSFSYSGGVATWDYRWYAFPFQLCSLPLYALPIALLWKDGKIKDSLFAFIATFAFFGGLCVYVFPNDVFTTEIGINIQTMTHHGIQLLAGIYIFCYNRKRLSHKWFSGSVIIFAIVSIMAIGLNIILHYTLPSTNFNMFYISPYFPCTLPLLNMLYPIMPYWAFLIMYLLGFWLVAYIIFIIAYGLTAFSRKKVGSVEKTIMPELVENQKKKTTKKE